jgi:Domain of unknown function (DUF6457)
MDRNEWIEGFARELEVDPPTDKEVEEILDLAAIAAHASERTAAPVACWIGGRVGRPLDELIGAARRVTGDEAQG